MVMLSDDRTNYPIPYASVWATIRHGSKIVFDERQWPMISEYMGPHYGNNVTLPGPGTYRLSLLVSPPVSARHIEYAHIWLKPHRVNFTFRWNPSREPPAGASARHRSDPPAVSRRRRRARGRRRRRGARAAARARSGHRSLRSRSGAARRPARRQFAWTETLSRDADGNPVAPRHDRLLMFDVNGRPGTDHARLLEAALRTLERRYRWGPGGLLFAAAGACRISRACSAAVADPGGAGAVGLRAARDRRLRPVSASGRRRRPRLAEIEDALVHGRRLPGADGPLDVSSALIWRETRTGFTGAGLPAAHQQVGGIPAGARCRRRRRCTWASNPA